MSGFSTHVRKEEYLQPDAERIAAEAQEASPFRAAQTRIAEKADALSGMWGQMTANPLAGIRDRISNAATGVQSFFETVSQPPAYLSKLRETINKPVELPAQQPSMGQMFGDTSIGASDHWPGGPPTTQPAEDLRADLPQAPLTTAAADEQLDTSGFAVNPPALPERDPNAPSAFTALGDTIQQGVDAARPFTDQAPPMSTPRLAMGAAQGAANTLRHMGGSADEIARTSAAGDPLGVLGNTLAGASAGLSAPGSVTHGAMMEGGAPEPVANIAGLAADIAAPATALDRALGGVLSRGIPLTAELIRGVALANAIDPDTVLGYAISKGHRLAGDAGRAIGEGARTAASTASDFVQSAGDTLGGASGEGRNAFGRAIDYVTSPAAQADAATLARSLAENRMLTPALGDPLTARELDNALAGNIGGGVLGLATAPEDATPEERARRAAAFAFGGTAAGAKLGRGLDLVADVRAGRAADGLGITARETVGEALERTLRSQKAGALTPAPSTDIERVLNAPSTRAHTLFWDATTPLHKLQEVVYQRLGREPTAEEDAWVMARLYPGRGGAAGQDIEDHVIPALRGLGKADEEHLNAFLALADNAGKAAAIGKRVERETLEVAQQKRSLRRSLYEGLKAADTPAKRRAYLEGVSAKTEDRLHRLEELYEEANARLENAEGRLSAATEGSSVERPDWARGRGRQRVWTNDELFAFADEQGLNPYRPVWGDGADPGEVRRWEREVINSKTGVAQTGKTPAELKEEAKRLRRDVRQIRREITRIEGDVMKGTVKAGDLRREARSVTRLDPAKQAKRDADWLADQQAKAAAKGKTAAEERMFSGGVHAQPLHEVRQEFVTRLGQERADRIFGAADQLWQHASRVRQRMADAGLIDDDTRVAWDTSFPHYVRTEILKHLEGDAAGSSVQGGRQLFTVADIGVGRLTEEGTTAARDLPVNSIIRQTYAVEQAARRNEVAQAILKMRDQDDELKAIMKPVLSHAEAKTRGLKAGEYVTSDHTLDKAREATFSVFVDGTRQEFVVSKALEQAFRIDPGQVPTALRLFSIITGAPLLRATATALNPLFVPLNAIRDAHTFLRRAPVWFKSNPVTAGGEFARAYLDSLRGGRIADWEELRRLGGTSSGGVGGSEPADVLRSLRRDGHLRGMVRPIDNRADFLGAVGDVLTLPFQPVRELGDRIERAPRLAAYRMALAGGMDKQAAALAARDITMDFSRAGTFSRVANVIVPFFNVALQAPERLVSLDFKKGRRLGSAISLTTNVVTPMLAAESWNQYAYPEDHANVPDYLKDRGIVVMLPTDPGLNPDGSPAQRPYLWIPLDPSVAFLNTIVREAINQPTGRSEREWNDVLASVIGSVSPIPADPSGAIAALAPPAIGEFVEQQANFDMFRGREIVPEMTTGRMLPEDQVFPTTAAAARGLAEVPGVGDVLGARSPVRIEHTLRGLAPGAANIGLAASDLAAAATGTSEREPNRNARLPILDAPVVGGLLGTVVRQTGGQLEENARKEVSQRQKAEHDAVIKILEADPQFRALSPAEQRQAKQDEANRIAARYAKEARYAVEAARFRLPAA